MKKGKITLFVLIGLTVLTLMAIIATIGDENITGKVVETYHQARINLVSRYLPPELTLQADKAEQYGNINIKIVDHGDWAQIVTITDIDNINEENLVGIGGKVFLMEKQNDQFILEKVNLENLIEKSQITKESKTQKKSSSILDRIF